MASSVSALVWRKGLGMLCSSLPQVSTTPFPFAHIRKCAHYAIGACGLIGYSSVGIYKSIRNIKFTKQDDPAAIVRQLGEVEYAQATDADKLYVVRVWCQTQMRVRLV